MRVVLAFLVVAVSLVSPASAQAWMTSKRAVLQTPSVAAEPDVVNSLGNADARALAEVNAASRKRQAEFDARLAESGSAALSSVCNGCGTTVGSARTAHRVVRAVRRVPAAPDAETIYSRARGFDPAQARLD